MSERIDAYPLCWPDGWRRTLPGLRTRAKFGTSTRDQSTGYVDKKSLSVAQAVQRVYDELGRMRVGDWQIVVSTNIALRLDGKPRSDLRNPSDPGAAVYWQHGKARRCIAVDRYDRTEDNLAAIAATLEAMRAIERHGGAEILQVLGVKMDATREEIDSAYRHLAMLKHPDRGGSDSEMARINAARDQAYEARA